ncbi:MAG: hypothetical protein R3C11_11330 [Planctomycetaceae bacterium]
MLAILIMLLQMHRKRLAMVPATPLGRAQLLAFLVNIAVLLIYAMLAGVSATNLFLFLVAILIGLLVILTRSEPGLDISQAKTPATSFIWCPGLLHWVLWAISPFFLAGLAAITMKFEMKQNQYRFEDDVPQEDRVEEAPATSWFEGYQRDELLQSISTGVEPGWAGRSRSSISV